MADTTSKNTKNEENFSKKPISEFLKKYGITKDPLYSRMRYLQITTYKENGKACLDAQQEADMDGLHEHIQKTGRMDGYPVPEPSGPVEEAQPTSAITVAETQQMSTAPNYATQNVRAQPSSTDDVAALVRSAQNKATGTLIAENLLARKFIENPEMLPDELKQKIKESGETPSVDPFAYADALMNLALATGLGG